MKCLVTTTPVIYYYDPKAELEIQCDTSKKGLGAALLQRGKLIAYTSRALTEIEQRYTQNEKEMLAIVFSLWKYNQYTYRRHMKIQSDHKQLQSWRSLLRVHQNAFKAWWWDFRNQALGFQIPWITNFWFRTQRSWETSVTIFWFRENSWEPIFISFNVQKHVVKHTFKLKNISEYY